MRSTLAFGAAATLSAALIGLSISRSPQSPQSSAPSTDASAPKKLAKRARIEGRGRQQLLIQQDENGNIPHDALMRAKQELELLPNVGVGGGLYSESWTEAGPGNIGGRIRSIVIHPAMPNTIFIGSVTGGLWKTSDGGTTWSRVDDRMGNLAISSIVMDPTNSNTMYAGTGEQTTGNRGAGIWKTTDGGATWARLASTNNSDFYWVNRLSFSADGSTLLCASGSIDFGESRGGIFRSTDGGVSWTRTDGASIGAVVRDIRFHPTKNNVVVAYYTDFTQPLSTVYYSTDGGVTWTPSTGISSADNQRAELAWHAGYSGAGNGACYAMKDAGGTTIYRSLDGGATWTQVSAGSGILGTQGSYDNTIWVDPSDTDANPANDVVVAGGISQYRSNDGGATFSVIGQWDLYPVAIHADHHAIVAAPGFNGSTNKTVYFGCDGGIWRTDDIYAVDSNSGWVQLNNGLPITQFYGASRHPGTDTVYAGAQDNGNLQTTPAKGFNGWTIAVGGDGGYTASDPTDGSYHYGEYIYGQLSRSSDGGQFGQDIWGDGKPAPFQITEAKANQGNFIAPFILDPNNPQRLLLGLLSLWRTNDARAPLTETSGPSWATIKAPDEELGPISAVTVAVGNADRIWVGHNSGAVFTTANGTSANPIWTRVDTQIPDRYITRIVLDPTNANTVYATLGGFVAGGIYKSTDNGANWTMINTPAVPVRDLEIHPTKGWLYAATEVGLITSEDGGTNWSSSASYSDVSVHEAFFSGDRLYLATFGRGVLWQKPAIGSVETKGVSCRTGDGSQTGPVMTSTDPVLGEMMTFTMTGLGDSSMAALLLGAEADPAVNFIGCSLYVQPTTMRVAGLFQVSGSTGTLSFRVPRSPLLAFNKAAFQGGVVTGAQMTIFLTNALIASPGY